MTMSVSIWVSWICWQLKYVIVNTYQMSQYTNILYGYTNGFVVATWDNDWHLFHGSLTRYVKLRVAHAPGIPGTFSPPFSTDFKGNRQLAIPACITARASRTCRDACRERVVTGKNVSSSSGACATHNFTHLARGPWVTATQGIFVMPRTMIHAWHIGIVHFTVT